MPFDEGCGGGGFAGARPAAPAGLSDGAPARGRRLRGRVAHHAGRVAEAGVEEGYRRRGLAVAARRWRGPGGEIDLILRDGARLVFVEVKSAETHAIAAERLSSRQAGRIAASASAFLAGEPGGQDTEMSFEVALVDGSGRIEIIENAFAF